MLPRKQTCDLKTATNKLTKTDIDLLNAMYSCKTGKLENILRNVKKQRVDLDVAVDGKWSKWSAWSECNAKCGPGRKARYYVIDLAFLKSFFKAKTV